MSTFIPVVQPLVVLDSSTCISQHIEIVKEGIKVFKVHHQNTFISCIVAV
jgi:hypothetical protein